MTKRDVKYDLMKGLGIILVVIGHCGMELGHYIIYMFHMPLFFFVSGRLHRDKPFFEAVKSKFVSLLVPFLIFFALTTVFDLILFPEEEFCTFDILDPKRSAGPLWFLYGMFWIYVIYLALNKLRSAVAFACSAVLTLMGYLLSINSIELPLFIDSALSCVIFYAIAHQTRNFDLTKNIYVKFLLAFVMCLGLYILYIIDFSILKLECNDIWSNTIMHNFSLYIISAVVGIIFIEQCSDLIGKSGSKIIVKPLALLGELSLYIFALHLLIINILTKHLDNDSSYYYPVVIVLSICISALVGLVIDKYIKGLIKYLNLRWSVS